ncbi:hypothetical protein ACH37Y_06445 [Sphingomonas paucimobilis]|uniref:hypothetical protein n=1 Tax=Sphingomonas paucimobilis TaxID=13689 RepID=UPI00378DE333
MRTLLWAGAMALACLSPSAAAQTYPKIIAPSTIVPPSGMAYSDDAGTTQIVSPAKPLPTGGVREAFQLVNANTPSPSATVYGGDYILAQTCASYGTLTLQVRGPDATTWLTLVTKSAADTGSGAGIALGSYAVVRVTVSGTAGCFASLSRVPA